MIRSAPGDERRTDHASREPSEEHLELDTLPDPPPEPSVEDEHPRGTFVLLLGFIVMIVLMWSLMYFLLIERS